MSVFIWVGSQFPYDDEHHHILLHDIVPIMMTGRVQSFAFVTEAVRDWSPVEKLDAELWLINIHWKCEWHQIWTVWALRKHYYPQTNTWLWSVQERKDLSGMQDSYADKCVTWKQPTAATTPGRELSLSGSGWCEEDSRLTSNLSQEGKCPGCHKQPHPLRQLWITALALPQS